MKNESGGKSKKNKNKNKQQTSGSVSQLQQAEQQSEQVENSVINDEVIVESLMVDALADATTTTADDDINNDQTSSSSQGFKLVADSSKKKAKSDHNNNTSSNSSSNNSSGENSDTGSNNNLEEVDLNQMSDVLDDDVTTPVSVNNIMSNNPMNDRSHVISGSVADNVNINKQAVGGGGGLLQNNTYTTSTSKSNRKISESIEAPIRQQSPLATMQSAKMNSTHPSTQSNLYPSLPTNTAADYSQFVNSTPMGLNTAMSSLLIDKQSMLAPQSLDNNALQRLVESSHLILDDNETLQVNSAQDFIALFKSASSAIGSANASPRTSSSGDSTGTTPPSIQQTPSSGSSSVSGGHSPVASSGTTSDDKLVKCVAIFGNTGDGKSHTLNHTFFNGRSIFRTSQKQETCTMGVWCAYDPVTNALIFDTEGLLGTTSNENKRMRLLLKVLAISDVIIYRTRAERLHNDLFKFLSDASVAYLKYFSKELKQAAVKLKLDTISSLGPDCVIFHETQHTETLCDEIDPEGHLRTVAHQLRDRFSKLDLSYDSFSSVEYVGTRTSPSVLTGAVPLSTDFSRLAHTVRSLLKNNSVRPPRKLSSVYHVFKVLNDKFNGVITKNQISTFADEYFTCSALCLACGKRCQHSINHLKDGVLHGCGDKCHYDHQYDNRVYVCKLCHEAGKEVVVLPKTAATTDNSFIGIVKYTYSGYVLECPHHGIIYRSRQYWYGNPDPESVVRTELKHIWPGQQNNVGTSHNLSRKIIDNVSYLSESLQSVSAKPTMYAKQWIADRVAPAYWVPNSDIQDCYKCRKPFNNLVEKKHHCRGCGRGFCDKCSAKRRIIPWWSLADKVRVCESCFEKPVIEEPKVTFTNQLTGAITAANASLNSNLHQPSDSNNSPSHSAGSQLASTASFGSSNSLNSLLSTATGGAAGSNDLMVRKVTETVQETISLLGYATKYPLDILKESARPAYWRPDSECLRCALCSRLFDPERLPLHHCRSCGLGVCHTCSPHQRPVPARGWDTPVRVCNNCVTILTPSDLSNSSLSTSDN